MTCDANDEAHRRGAFCRMWSAELSKLFTFDL